MNRRRTSQAGLMLPLMLVIGMAPIFSEEKRVEIGKFNTKSGKSESIDRKLKKNSPWGDPIVKSEIVKEGDHYYLRQWARSGKGVNYSYATECSAQASVPAWVMIIFIGCTKHLEKKCVQKQNCESCSTEHDAYGTAICTCANKTSDEVGTCQWDPNGLITRVVEDQVCAL